MEILSILTGAFVAGCELGIKKYTEENVRDGEERRDANWQSLEHR